MADQLTINEQADKLRRRRARMLPMLGFLFITQQASFFSRPPGDRAVDYVQIGAWVVLATVILAVLATGGSWFRRRAVRALLKDDVSRANRASAMTLGLVVMIITAIMLYVLLPIWPHSSREVIHLIVSVGLVTALVRFGLLERRALG